ncbi:MAG TPA: CHAD domain-containing protein [Melioribacteraceae bacterium]|nr:CHAD domain-containing protein [Melioribacteraceae bacterium]
MKGIKKIQIIKGLRKNLSFEDASKIITNNKLQILIKLIYEFLDEQSIDALHDLRIAVRRLRYSLELFYKCYPKKSYLKFYKSLELLQDKLGEIRDLDVMKEKLDYFEETYGIVIPNDLHVEMENKKTEFNANLINYLNDFISSKLTKKFLITKQRLK